MGSPCPNCGHDAPHSSPLLAGIAPTKTRECWEPGCLCTSDEPRMSLADAVREDGDPCCSGKGCLSGDGVPAVVTVFWPGQTRGMCWPCAYRAACVAGALGFVLTSKPRVRSDRSIKP